MNLTDVQLELHSIEKNIIQLEKEINKINNANTKQESIDFKTITSLACKYPIENKNLINSSEYIQKSYISLLSYLLQFDPNNINEKLLFLTRIAAGIKKNKYSAEQVYRLGLGFDINDFAQNSNNMIELKYELVVDALILVNIVTEATDSMLLLISDIAALMGLTVDDLRNVSYISKAVLLDDYNILDNVVAKGTNVWCGKFYHYIPGDWIVKQRNSIGYEDFKKTRFGGMFVSPSVPNVKFLVAKGVAVKKGDKLIEYEYNCSESNDKGIVKSMKNGMVIYMKSNYIGGLEMRRSTKIFVTSYFDDYKNFVKWCKDTNEYIPIED